MAKNFFRSYIWLLETLHSRGPLTLKELQGLWLRSSVNDEGKELATRTFHNHIQSIADIFGIEIACDRRDNTYYIDNGSEIGGSGVRNWMLEALSLNGLLNESAGLKDRIMFEDVPSSRKYLTTVIRAMRSSNVLNVTYHSYDGPVPRSFVLEPYCLREFKRRWYLYARKNDDAAPHMFALDRMLSMETGTEKFQLPEKFNAHDYFAGIYGARVYPDMKPETVILKVSARQAKYFMSLPLHQSQEVVEETPEFTVFRYFITPDYDFKQDVLSYGNSVEVLEPHEVRTAIGDMVRKLNDKYNGTDV